MLPNIDIIIVNWNSAHQLCECLDSIIESSFNNVSLNRVIIVDNASSDQSLENIKNIVLPIDIIKNSENKGFGVACNQGAAISKSDYILFLNPDTKLFDTALDRAVNFIHNLPINRVGAVGIQLIDASGNVQRSCARFPSLINFCCSILGVDKIIKNKFTSYLMTDWDHQTVKIVDHVMGAFYLINSETFRLIGEFDENFFVYFEDLDLSWRLHQQGFDSYYLANVQSFHKGGGTSEAVKSTRIFYSIRSRILYAYKHFGFPHATTILIASLFIEPFTRIGFSIIKFSLPQAQETFLAYIQLIVNYQGIYKLIKQQLSTKKEIANSDRPQT
jgi:N-acetylglucosaminyl-diphospho-decaprenol L-rhamnosyltransferase